MDINHLKVSARLLMRHKLHSIINISGLSLGLACAMLIILYVKDELSFDLFHKDADRLYRIVQDINTPDPATTGNMPTSSLLSGPRFAASIPELESFVRIKKDVRDLVIGGEIKSQDVLVADSNFFEMLTFPFLHGDPATALNDPRTVAISEDLALVVFGSTDALNKTILIREQDKLEPYLVTGIAKRCPQNSSVRFDVVLPLESLPRRQEFAWTDSDVTTFIKLTPGAEAAKVEEKMQRVFQKEAGPELDRIKGFVGYAVEFRQRLLPIIDVHLDKVYSEHDRLTQAGKLIYSYILSGIALFILLIASFNFINLTIAQSAKRAKEIGVRKVIGGARSQLIFQFLSESFVLCGLAFVGALLLTYVTLPFFNTAINKALSFSYLLDGGLIAVFIFTFVITGLLAGAYPAFVLSGYNPVQTLYQRFRLSGKGYFQKSLVLIQFTLATLLTIGTFTVWKQFDFLTTKDLGFDQHHLVFVYKQNFTKKEIDLFRQRLSSEPGIEGVTAMDGAGMDAKTVDGKNIYFSYMTVDEFFLPLNRIPLVAGRNFSSSFPSDSANAVLVNETFVKEAGFKNPVGQELSQFAQQGPKHTIVGVVRDYHFNELTHAISPQLFVLNNSRPVNRAVIRLVPGSETRAMKKVEATFKDLFPMVSYQYVFLDDRLKSFYEGENKWRRVMLFGAVLTIFVSCIGIFGLSLMSAEKRFKEIGIRKVLGATVRSIVIKLSREYVVLVQLAIVIAVPLAYIAAERWLQSYPYRISLGAAIFIISGCIVTLIALLTVGYQSIRAALTNPVRWLRSE